MEEATHTAWVLVAVESTWRFYCCNPLEVVHNNSFQPGFLYYIAYVLCIGAIYLNLKDFPFFKSTVLRNFITFLHAADGVNALILGLSIYYQSNTLVFIGILAMTKFFLLHLLSRMVTGVKAYTHFEVTVQTTKTYMHHTGSFFYITNPKVALITALWRFTSMNGHAILSYKSHMSTAAYERSMWIIAHARNIVITSVLITCFVNEEIRRGFAVSAIGHIAYMIVRLGPVFRLGSVYIGDEEQRERWSRLTDRQRLVELFYYRKYPHFGLEMLLLFGMSVYFVYLRLTTTAILVPETCTFV